MNLIWPSRVRSESSESWLPYLYNYRPLISGAPGVRQKKTNTEVQGCLFSSKRRETSRRTDLASQVVLCPLSLNGHIQLMGSQTQNCEQAHWSPVNTTRSGLTRSSTLESHSLV
jgi:hypothetical protein